MTAGVRCGPESARTKGTEEERRSAGSPKTNTRSIADRAETSPANRASRTAWRGGAQRGEGGHGRSVDQEERAQTAYADAGVSEHFAAPAGAPWAIRASPTSRTPSAWCRPAARSTAPSASVAATPGGTTSGH